MPSLLCAAILPRYQAVEKWPDIPHFNLHLHNARNMALASTYEAMRILGSDDTLELMGSIGGIGGCPYCGNGRATGTTPTEDLLHMRRQQYNEDL